LEQPDFDIDLHIDFFNSCIKIKERPYLDEQSVTFDIGSLHMSHQESIVTGRHANLPHLDMKLSMFMFKMQEVLVTFNSCGYCKKVSNLFNIDFSYTYPNYSELLEKISSKILDKASDIVVNFHPFVRLNFS
jgi:hypothetical protein